MWEIRIKLTGSEAKRIYQQMLPTCKSIELRNDKGEIIRGYFGTETIPSALKTKDHL